MHIEVPGGKIELRVANIPVSMTPEELEQIVKRYARHWDQIFRVNSEGRPILNAIVYGRIIKDAFYQSRESMEVSFNLILLAAGFLTVNPKNAWTFSDESMNPRYGLPADNKGKEVHLGRAFFAHIDDIIGYGKNKFKNRTGWRIFQMKNVFEKQEIC